MNVRRFNVGDKVVYASRPGSKRHAIVYGVIAHAGQCLLMDHSPGKDDYGPYRSVLSDSDPSLELDQNPPVAKSVWERKE